MFTSSQVSALSAVLILAAAVRGTFQLAMPLNRMFALLDMLVPFPSELALHAYAGNLRLSAPRRYTLHLNVAVH